MIEQNPGVQPEAAITNNGELFSVLLRLHPVEAGWVSPSSGSQAHAAFLDIVRQNDVELAERLHQPNQRRPFTVGLLQGFNSLTPAQLDVAMAKNQNVQVLPGQVYWLRVTMLDASVFGVFVQHLIARSRTLVMRLGDARFEISRLIGSAESQGKGSSWAAYSSFAELRARGEVQKLYAFEFASPTTFSLGQKEWGKMLKLLPEPAYVFESLAKQWESFAPSHLRMAEQGLTPQGLVEWCDENLIVHRYALETRNLHAHKFSHMGFQGKVTYEVKGSPHEPCAAWLTPLARFALFSGVGYKTSMGMGQARCIHVMGGSLAGASPATTCHTTGEE